MPTPHMPRSSPTELSLSGPTAVKSDNRLGSVLAGQTVKNGLKQAGLVPQLSGGIRIRGGHGVSRSSTVAHLLSDDLKLVLAGQSRSS